MPTISGKTMMLAGLNGMWNNVMTPTIQIIPQINGNSVSPAASSPRKSARIMIAITRNAHKAALI